MDQPQPLPTTNPTASLADKTVQDLFSDAVPLLEAAAIAAQPILGTPILKQLWQSFFRWIMGLVGKLSGLVTGYIVMDIQKALALHKAAQALIDLREAQKAGFPNGIQAASNAVDQAIAPILHYVGAVKPN